jgi:hypothetical protein
MKEALEILDQIEEQVNTCCAITMYPEDVVDLINKLRKTLEERPKSSGPIQNYYNDGGDADMDEGEWKDHGYDQNEQPFAD